MKNAPGSRPGGQKKGKNDEKKGEENNSNDSGGIHGFGGKRDAEKVRKVRRIVGTQQK